MFQTCSSPSVQFSSVQFIRSVMSDSLRPPESQCTRPPCPSKTPRVYSNSCPSSRGCHPAISSSVVPFSSCPQSLPASGSFPTSQLFAWGGRSPWGYPIIVNGISKHQGNQVTISPLLCFSPLWRPITHHFWAVLYSNAFTICSLPSPSLVTLWFSLIWGDNGYLLTVPYFKPCCKSKCLTHEVQTLPLKSGDNGIFL